MPRLERWAVVVDERNPYVAPELRPILLQGIVYGHPRHPVVMDGEPVTTSPLKALNVAGCRATTRNTEYELGEPCPKWAAWVASQGKAIKDYSFQPQGQLSLSATRRPQP